MHLANLETRSDKPFGDAPAEKAIEDIKNVISEMVGSFHKQYGIGILNIEMVGKGYYRNFNSIITLKK
jgi:hypothetical protein